MQQVQGRLGCDRQRVHEPVRHRELLGQWRCLVHVVHRRLHDPGRGEDDRGRLQRLLVGLLLHRCRDGSIPVSGLVLAVPDRLDRRRRHVRDVHGVGGLFVLALGQLLHLHAVRGRHLLGGRQHWALQDRRARLLFGRGRVGGDAVSAARPGRAGHSGRAGRLDRAVRQLNMCVPGQLCVHFWVRL